jgi:hypothetical protein
VDFDCTTTPATGTVTGTVTANGSPVSGATVALDGRTATTDANGTFSFTNVDPDTYTVAVTADGFTCDPRTTTVTAGQTSTVDVTCTASAPSGTEIAAQPYSLSGTIQGTDACGLGTTISNPGPITIRFDPATNTVTIESDADVAGVYTPGQPWTGTGESTFSSGGMTFVLRETAMGTWQRSSGMIVLPGTLTFEVFQGTTEVCESRYDATYTQLTASSARFKTGIVGLLPEGVTIFGLRPVAYRYVHPYGDPSVPRIGLIAEEVERVFPEAVAVDRTGRARGIAYVILRARLAEQIADRAGAKARSWLQRGAGAISPGYPLDARLRGISKDTAGDESIPRDPLRHLRPGGDAELVEHMLGMAACGVGADLERPRDLVVPQSVAQRTRDADLLRGQQIGVPKLRVGTQLPEERFDEDQDAARRRSGLPRD